METPIDVIVGNPPYSAGQKNENDNAKNLSYPTLDEKIRSTYAEASSATLKNKLYDSYIRAFRWASDRIEKKGIVSFVTNGGWLDGQATVFVKLSSKSSTLFTFSISGATSARKVSSHVRKAAKSSGRARVLLLPSPSW